MDSRNQLKSDLAEAIIGSSDNHSFYALFYAAHVMQTLPNDAIAHEWFDWSRTVLMGLSPSRSKGIRYYGDTYETAMLIIALRAERLRDLHAMHLTRE
jgi:hypothetical protein